MVKNFLSAAGIDDHASNFSNLYPDNPENCGWDCFNMADDSQLMQDVNELDEL